MNNKKVAIFSSVIVVIAIAIVAIWWNPGPAERSQEKLDLAVKYLNENKYEQAILAYNDAIKIDPKEVKAYQGLAKVYTLQSQYNDAKATYDRGLTAVAKEDQNVLQLGLGGMYIDQGQMDAAQKTFQQIRNGNGKCLEAYWGLAMVYQQKEDNTKAEAMLRMAVEQNPNEYRAYNALALFQKQNGQTDQALENLVKSLSLEINQQEAYLILSNLYNGRWSELRTKTDGIGKQQAAAMLEFYSYYAAREYQSAIQLYETNMKNQDNNVKAKILAAIAMYKTGNTKGAEALIKQLADKEINDWLLSDIAEYYLTAGDKEKAKLAAIKALQGNNTNLDAVALLQRINTNDQEGKIYAAEFLLYNWKPVSEVKDILAESEIKLFIATDTSDSAKNETASTAVNEQENSDPKLALLQAAAEYCKQNIPYLKNRDIVYEPPYGNPQGDDYIVGIKEMKQDTATVVVGLWRSEGGLMIFRRTASGSWEYVRDIEDNYDEKSEPAPTKAVSINEKERIARDMLYSYNPKIKKALDAGTRPDGDTRTYTTYVDSEWDQSKNCFRFRVYDAINYNQPDPDGIGGYESTWGRYSVYPDSGQIWDDTLLERLR